MKLYTLLFALLLTFSTQLISQNYALYFDGIDDKVGVLDAPELNPSSALTIETWINAESWATSIWAGVILSKQGSNPDKGYGFTVGENGRVEFNHSIDEAWEAVSTSQILGLNTWYHLAGVYSGSSMKLYINGILQSSVDVTGTLTTSEGVVMNIADNPTWTGRFFNGKIDEVRIWDVARTQQEIQDHMTSELTGNETGLVAYWPMNEGTGTTTADESGNDNTGTLLNMNENSWVEGFTPPGNDVGVIGIASPSAIGSGFTSNETIKVDIKNFATDEITGFDISYQINDWDIMTETVNATISAFDTYIHSFENTVDLSGLEEIQITAFTSLVDDSNNNNDSLTETISQTNNYFLFDETQHNYGAYGQTHTKALYMPEDLSGYSQVFLYVDLNCPGGGCDPWDQPAKVSIIKDALSYEIARYITPYGIACGDWVWDITDFKSIMTGKTEFQSYVQVWGASGWLVTMRLELIPGTPENMYSKVTRLWNEDNWVYGDDEISYDFPTRIIPVDESTEAAKIRMTITGHGQGNTSNAAEFSNFTHHVWVNGTSTFEQHLWKDDCNQNTCSPQNGTWQYSRSGWCPGQDVQPWEWNLEELFAPGQDISLDFVLQEYDNLLDTNYNGGSHTEPHYRCHTYLIEYADEVFVDVSENTAFNETKVTAYPNPTTGIVNITANDKNIIYGIYVYRADGHLVLVKHNIEYAQYTLSIEDNTTGIYFVRVVTNNGTSTIKVAKY